MTTLVTDDDADVLRVTVSAGRRRVDLVLPGSVPVAELLPDLARSMGLLDAATAHGGFRLATARGRELTPACGLAAQGVADGVRLTLSAGVDDEPPRRYDDVVEAMADVVERDLPAWRPAAARRTAIGVAALLLASAAAALGLLNRSDATAAVAAAMALLLLAGALALARDRSGPPSVAGVVVAWLAVGYAAVAGLLALPAGSPLAVGLVAAGGGALVVGTVALTGLGAHRLLMLPAVLVGGLLGLGGLVLEVTGWDPDVVAVGVLALLVVLGGVLPQLALAAAPTRPAPAPAGGVNDAVLELDDEADPDPIDGDRVRRAAATAHTVLVALTGTVGLLIALLAPLAVRRGVAGTLLAVVCAGLLLARTRHQRTAAGVRTGLAGGVAGLLAVAGSVLVGQPDWRPWVVAALAAAGGVVLVTTLVPAGPSVRRARLVDLAESMGLLALVPLTVVALGALSAIPG